MYILACIYIYNLPTQLTLPKGYVAISRWSSALALAINDGSTVRDNLVQQKLGKS